MLRDVYGICLLIAMAFCIAVINSNMRNITRLENIKLENELKSVRHQLYKEQIESATYKALHKKANEEYMAYVNNAISDKRRLGEQDAIIRELQDELRYND